MRVAMIAAFSCALASAQTFSNTSVTDLGPHSAHVVSSISQDGWVQLNLGTVSGGPYTTYSSATYCTNSPEVVFSGGGGTGAAAFILQISNTGVPNYPSVLFSGTGYTTAPTATLVDRCPPSYAIQSASWAAGTATVTTAGDGGGSYYVGGIISVTGITPAGFNVSNVAVTGVNGPQISYAVASNPGSYTNGGTITGAPGSGATLSVTCCTAGSITGLSVSGGSGYHGEDYNYSLTQNPSAAGTHLVNLSVGGLAPATKFYAVLTYRPHQNDSVGLVTSSQFSFTTAASCAGPCLPALPQITYNPARPPTHPSFTSGYTTIPIAFNSTKNECAATATVGPIAYGGSAPGPTGSWTVSNGDTIQTILNEIGYGAILDIAQGSQCLIPTGLSVCPTSASYPGQYVFCVVNIDPLATSINDPNHRFIVIRTHQNSAADFPPQGFRTGPAWASKLASFVSQRAAGTGTGPSNGEGLATDIGSTSFVIPVHHYWLENIEWSTNVSGNHGVAITIGSSGNSAILAYPPEYIVLDRVFLNAPTRTPFTIFSNETTMTTGISGVSGGYNAISNSYIGILDNDQSLSQGIYFTDCGAGPLAIDNNLIQAYGQGLYVETTAFPYCGPTATSVAATTPTRSYDDVTLTRNTFYWPLSTLSGNPAWDGLSRPAPRNQIESKLGRRWLIQGNVCNGQWAGQTEGECMAMTPVATTSSNAESGSLDWTVTFNLFTKAAIIATFSGTRGLSNPGPPDPSITARMLFSNNYAYNIGKNLYTESTGGAGITPEYFSSANEGQDFTFRNNTLPNVSGDVGVPGFSYFPTWWYVTGPPLMGGLVWQSNILSMDGGGTSPASIAANTDSGCCLNFPPLPTVNLTNTSTIFASAFVNIGAAGTIQNAYTWGHNIVIGGYYGGGEPWTQMTDAQVSSLSLSNPTGDTYVSSGGVNTLAARLANAGVPGLNSGNPTCTPTTQNPCAAGVNQKGLEAALGIVSNIVVRPGPSALSLSYTAPDSRACSVDSSPNGVSWTRTADSGGSRNRSVLVSGLSSSTTYQYKVECYYSQTAPWFAAAWDPSNLVTDGVSAVTAAGGTRTLPISFVLPSGASQAQFTLTGVGGSPISQTCSASPCAVPNVPNGMVLVQIAYLSSGGKTLLNGTIWTQ